MTKYSRRYGIYIFIALTILLIQFFLALSFYSSNQFEENFLLEGKFKKNSQTNDKRLSFGTPTNSIESRSWKNSHSNKPSDISDHSSQSRAAFNSLVSKNVKSKSKLDIGSLDFIPNCTIILKDAIHAIKRARTNYCKKELADIACQLQSEELFPKYLPQFCPNRNVKKKNSVEDADPNQKSVRIAFLLTFNGRSVRQITRLIKAIYSHRHIYFIHIDKRLNYLFEELLVLETLPNIHLSRNRLSTIWGGASLLEMLINSFNELLHHKNWDYLINLSESDFPIKPLQRLENFLAANYGHNFVKSHGQDPQRFLIKQGLDKTFHQCDDHMWRLGDRKIPEGIEVDGGSDWVALTRDFCQYIVDNDDELLKGLRTFFKYTLLPAETFFHTVLRNSAFCDTIIDNNLHITNWRRSQGCKCQYRHIVDWCGCSPNDFRLEDWSRIVDSLEKPLFFARKFEPAVNQEIINRIEMLISKKQVKVGQLSYDKYWQNDFHHKFDNNDDAKVSFYYLLGLLGKSFVYKICSETKIPSDQLLSTIEVKQAHLFFENDSFKGLLLTFIDLIAEKNSAAFYEIYAQPVAHSNPVGQQISPEIKLISAKVCSDYDMKEQIFRNFACTLHPFSEIGVNHKWSSDGKTNFSVSFVWIDPVEHVAGSFEVQIEWPHQAKNNQQTITLYHKPNFNHPLRPGTWKLSILYKWKPILEMKFLVLPYIFEKGLFLDKTSASNLHNGPVAGKYLDHNFTAVERLLKLRTNPSTLDSQAIRNSQKTNGQLIDWSLELLENFWTIYDVCLVNKLSTCQRAKINSCQSTPWSSFYPDLKSKLI